MQTYQPEKDLKIAEDVYKTSIEGLFFLPHHNYLDNRGFYSEVSRIRDRGRYWQRIYYQAG